MYYTKCFLVVAFLAVSAILNAQPCSQRFTIPTTIPTSTIAAGDCWIIDSMATVTLDDNAVLNIYGTLYIQPGSTLLADTNAVVVVNQGGSIIIAGGYSSIRLAESALLRLRTNGIVTLGSSGTIVFDGINSKLRIESSGYIQMSSGSQILHASGLACTLDAYTTRPLHGTGTVSSGIFNCYTDFTVDSTDNITFLGTTRMNFLGLPMRKFNIRGIAEFMGTAAVDSVVFAGNLDSIKLYQPGCWKISNIDSVCSVREVLGQAGTSMLFNGISGRSMMLFQGSAGIKTYGGLDARKYVFTGEDFGAWKGIKIWGIYSSVNIDECALVNAIIENGLHLRESVFPYNRVRYSDIVHILDSTVVPDGGAGILLDLVDPSQYSRLRVGCSSILGYNTGIHNSRGDIELYGVHSTICDIGLINDSASADIERSWFMGNLDRGIVVNGFQPRTGFDLIYSDITYNQSLQIDVYGDATIDIRYSNIYYQPGDTSNALIRTNDYSVALVQENWWGYFPAVTQFFDIRDFSYLQYVPELGMVSYWDTDCMNWWKAEHAAFIGGISNNPAMTAVNYPNPFNPSTVIEYSLPEDSPVEVAVFSIDGRKVATLVDEWQTAGTHRVRFSVPSAAASGVYLYTIHTPGNTLKRMMLFTK